MTALMKVMSSSVVSIHLLNSWKEKPSECICVFLCYNLNKWREVLKNWKFPDCFYRLRCIQICTEFVGYLSIFNFWSFLQCSGNSLLKLTKERNGSHGLSRSLSCWNKPSLHCLPSYFSNASSCWMPSSGFWWLHGELAQQPLAFRIGYL